jgi:hypothetical protein
MPKPSDYQRPDVTVAQAAAAYKADKIIFDSNPIRADIINLKKEYQELVNSGQDVAVAKQIYEDQIIDLRNSYIEGMKAGAPDPKAEEKQNGIMNAAWNMDFMGVIQGFFFSLPLVGDFLAAGKEYLGAMMTGGPGVDFTTAMKRIELKRALGGAASYAGVKNGNNLIGLAIESYENKDFVPTERPTDHLLELHKPAAQPKTLVPTQLTPQAEPAQSSRTQESIPLVQPPTSEPARPASEPVTTGAIHRKGSFPVAEASHENKQPTTLKLAVNNAQTFTSGMKMG